MDKIIELINSHLEWLQNGFCIEQVDQEWTEITTPYLDRHNDCIQIYMKEDNDGYLLHDDNYTINDLVNSGCSVENPKTQVLLDNIFARFGVQRNGEEIYIQTTEEDFAFKMQNLIQAILVVNSLGYLVPKLEPEPL